MIANTIALILAGVSFIGLSFSNEDSPTVDEVTELLRENEDNFSAGHQKLEKLGEKAFPAYVKILDRGGPFPSDISNIFYVLTQVKADRSRFLEYAINGLAHKNVSVRYNAVQLLAQIGCAKDTAPVVALLSDKQWEIPFAAAKTLAAIGDRRTVDAFDVWLQTDGIQREDRQLLEHVKKCREELKARLDKAASEKKKLAEWKQPRMFTLMSAMFSMGIPYTEILIQDKGQTLGASEVKDLLRYQDKNQYFPGHETLIRSGETAFPAYVQILEEKDAFAKDISAIFGILAKVKADRSRFLEHAIHGLSHKIYRVRESAVQLLAQIGSERDSVPVVAMLSDDHREGTLAAAKTLTAIGNQRTVIAFDVWLQNNRREDRELLRKIETYRDELNARLDKEGKAKK